MSKASAVTFGPFEGGLPHKLESWLGLTHAGRPGSCLRRALLVVAIGWLPLPIFTALSGDLLRTDWENSFLLDFSAHARFLLASPLLVLAEAACVPRLAVIAGHFFAAGLIAQADQPRYERALISTRYLTNSIVAQVTTIVLAYSLVAALLLLHPQVPLWHGTAGPAGWSLSPAGWWALLISLPILMIQLLGWLWRMYLWARFLWLMSRIELRLIAAHPDRTAGLQFVGSSLKGFLVLGLALGVIVAGPVFDQVFHHQASLADFKYLIVGVVIFSIVLCAGPLLVFARRLLSEEYRGIFEYGALATKLGQQLEHKWMNGRPVDPDALGVQDFSATADLDSITANVYAIRLAPLDRKNLLLLTAATLLPFLPTVLLTAPLEIILKKIAGVFL